MKIKRDSNNSIIISDDKDAYVCEIIAQENDFFSARELKNAERIKEAFELTWIKKVVADIDYLLSAIDSDDRFHYSSANIQINAPLALIQADFEARVSVLQNIRDSICNRHKEISKIVKVCPGPIVLGKKS